MLDLHRLQAPVIVAHEAAKRDHRTRTRTPGRLGECRAFRAVVERFGLNPDSHP